MRQTKPDQTQPNLSWTRVDFQGLGEECETPPSVKTRTVHTSTTINIYPKFSTTFEPSHESDIEKLMETQHIFGSPYY